MAEPAFDTLAIARELERDYGFEAKQAEGAATMIHRHLVGNVATKDDVKHMKEALDGKFDVLEEKFGVLEENFGVLDGKIKGLATKDEIANLATKDEIANLATKDEVAKLATKDEIANLATRDELRAEIAEVRTEIAQAGNKTIYALGGLIGVLFVIDRLLPLFGG